MEHIVVYGSDLYGNDVQYRRLIDYAKSISAKSVILGGDICPKGNPREKYMDAQKEFLEDLLPELLHPFKKALPDSRIFLMMGNDDCAVNMDVMEKHDPGIYHAIHGKRIKIAGDIDIVGYSCVPITPFKLKDWEKFDLFEPPPAFRMEYDKRKAMDYNLYGLKSSKSGWKQFWFDPCIEADDSIQNDLSDEMFCKNPRRTVYVMHTPPDRTDLDMIADGKHAGSMAVKQFIHEFQPYLTLHGHMHETVDVSGNFRHYVGNTLCMSSGNHHISDNVAVLVFDLYEPWNAVRKVL